MSTFTGNVINGVVRPASDGSSQSNLEPATGAALSEVAISGPEDVGAACQAASAAQRTWAVMESGERRKRLLAWAQAIRDEQEQLAVIEARDSGIPLRTMRAGIAKGAD